MLLCVIDEGPRLFEEEEGDITVTFEVEVPGKLMKKMAPALICMSKLLKVRNEIVRSLQRSVVRLCLHAATPPAALFWRTK